MTIHELREQLQREKIEGRERPWGYAWLQRGPSVYLTYLLIRIPITPNQLTVASIFLGIAGAAILLSPVWYIKLIGLFLLYIHLILDRVDGEVARYKQIYSLKGIYLDEVNHALVPPLFFLAAAWGVSNISIFHPLALIAAGGVAAIASILVRVTINLPYQIYMKKYVKHPDILPLSSAPETTGDMRARYSALYPVAKFIHQFQDFFVTLAVFALALIGERVLTPYGFLYPWTSYLIMGYALYLALIVIENIVKGMRTIESRMRELGETIHG